MYQSVFKVGISLPVPGAELEALGAKYGLAPAKKMSSLTTDNQSTRSRALRRAELQDLGLRESCDLRSGTDLVLRLGF